MLRSFLLIALVALALPVAATAAETASDQAKPAAIGDTVPNLSFKDIHYLPRTLSDFGDKRAFVLVFTNLDCPLVKRYLPRVSELDRAYRDRGVQFLSVNTGPEDSIVEIAYQAIKSDCDFPFAKDFDGDVVRAVGVERTPQVVVLDGALRLRYRGRIDSQYRLAGVKPDTGREDLKEALEDVLADREVRVAETPVDGCKITPAVPPRVSEEVTYAEHVAGIMKAHCQECHRPSTTAPFALLSYDEVKANGETIAEVVREQRMPPCFSSKEQTDLVNRRELSPRERDLVVAWVRAGMPLGDVSKMPEPIQVPDSKWMIGQPDLVIEMPKAIKIPAQGYVPYKYVILPHQFKEDTWVQKIEILPGNKQVVHHCNMVAVRLGEKLSTENDFITGYVPGGDPMVLDPHQGFRIPKGSALALQIHYITVGAEASDQISVGFVYAKDKVEQEIKHFQVHDASFAIPPGAPNHRVVASRIFPHDATGIGMFSHMHLRGKDMIFSAIYPNGNQETLAAIPNYDFNWQMSYRWAPGTKKFPKGTKIECVAHFDNSTFNPFNPDPTKEVREGQQTYQEMMYGFFFFVEDDEHLNLDVDPNTGHVLNQTAAPEQQAQQ